MRGSGIYLFPEIDGEAVETVSDFIFGLQNHCKMVTAAMNLDAYSLEGKL